MLRAFLKDSAIYSIPALISRGLSLLLVPLYTRVMSPSDYGSFDLLTMFAGIINLTIALEVTQGVARFYTAEEISDHKVAYASSAFWFTFFCYGGFTLFTLVFADQLAVLIMGQTGLEIAFRIGILYIFTNGLSVLFKISSDGASSKDYAANSLLMSFFTAGVSFLLAFVLGLGLQGLLIGMLVGSFMGTVFGLWRLRRSFRFLLDAFRLREMLSFSTPLVFSGVAVWLSLYVDRLMINYFLTIEEVGLSGIGYRLASIASLVMVGFKGALTPLIYSNYQSETHTN